MGIKNLKISIVVPIYKVEKYLNRCVESLINQTYENIEIILVDDGSPDNCPMICDMYKEKDIRIKVIHKENGGLSDSRNEGINEATGDYILFVDSDDYIELNTCEQFIKVIEGKVPDIVAGNAKRIENSNIKIIKHSNTDSSKVMSGKEYLKHEFKNNTMHMPSWMNLYSKHFIETNKLEFKVGILHEDLDFTPRAFLKADKVIGSDIVFYNYIIREGSITTQKNKFKSAKHIVRICKNLEILYCSIEDIELKRWLNNSLVDIYLNIFQVAELHKRENSSLVDKEFLRNKSNTRKNKLRVGLFLISPNIYYYVNKISKLAKH